MLAGTAGRVLEKLVSSRNVLKGQSSALTWTSEGAIHKLSGVHVSPVGRHQDSAHGPDASSGAFGLRLSGFLATG